MLHYDPECDAYYVLGVEPGAPQPEVDAAFRRAARTWHPDKSPAPDAAERFRDVKRAGEILRDPERRRVYDRLREAHIGRTLRPRRAATPEPYVPMRPPPAWLVPRVRVHRDAALFNVESPRTGAGPSRFFTALALVALGGAAVSAELTLGLLAVVLWALGRVFSVPPHQGQLAWAKIIPGRRVAEYHSLDQQRHHYHRLAVPFEHLRVALVESREDYRIEILGFPRPARPVLLRTRDLGEAKRCAREAGRWLQLPLAHAS